MSPVPTDVLDVTIPGDELLRRVASGFARTCVRPPATELDATERYPAELYQDGEEARS